MRALVTGGAGLIGSHIADLLLAHGWSVRVLDNLEPQTHRFGFPDWLPPDAEFLHGDVRDVSVWRAALCDIDIVFHQAAYGGYMPEIAKFFHVNTYGTALMLETIRDANLPIKKVIVASSQAVYLEGAGWCSTHRRVFPTVRRMERMQVGDFAVRCPVCGIPTISVPTPEETPIGGESVYALTKVDQERLALLWGRQTGIPVVALRYSCTYGPRQSIFNPYTGVIAIFCTRLINGQAPVLYEDGAQTRDFSYVEDIARANLAVASTDRLDGLAVNVGSGEAVSIRSLAELLADALTIDIEPVAEGAFRPGEIRDLISDVSLLRSIGHVPSVDIIEGIARYLAWIRTRTDITEYFSAADRTLRANGMVQRVVYRDGAA